MFRVTLDPKDVLRIIWATRRLEKELKKQKEKLPWKCSVDFVNLLRRNVMTQNLPPYAPYNARYRLWKEQYGASTGFWVLFGDFVNNLQSFKQEGGWKAGIPAGVYDRGGKSWFGRQKGRKGSPKPIAMYAYVMEYGGNYPGAGYHPPRPLFRPTKEEYKAGGMKKRLNETASYLKGTWR